MKDPETGIAIRFVRQWDASADVLSLEPIDFRLARVLGLSRWLPFELHGYGVNEPGAWSRLYGGLCRNYFRDFGWRAAFLGGSCE